MDFASPLVRGSLLRRYKRFLADVRLDSGEEVTAHCANPGSMLGLAEPGRRVWLEPSNNPKRKLAWGWKLLELDDGTLVGVDTGVPNRLVAWSLAKRTLPVLGEYAAFQPEVRTGNSRIDFRLTAAGLPDCYLEVKSVTLSRAPGLAEFPDSVTRRGSKHLEELIALREQGHHAAMLFVVQRTDATRFAPAADIDPAYARALARAATSGVEIFCVGTRISPQAITISGELPVLLGQEV